MFRRMRQGWELTKKSWGVVREHPTLIRLPFIGGLIALVVAIVIAGPGLLLTATDDDATVYGGYALIAIGSYLASCVVIYYNVVLAGAANEALTGRPPDVQAAHAVARSRIGAIAGWAVIAAVVGLLINALRDRGGAGRIVAMLGAAAWGFLTFLVIPVLALEGVGPIAAIKRSGALVRERWGQQVTGNVVIGGFAAVAAMLGGVLAMVGGVLLFSGVAGAVIGAVLIAIGILLAIGGGVLAGATRGVFGVALYHFSADNQAVGPFTEHELAAAAS